MGDVLRKLVLVVDDDASVRTLLTKALEAKGFAVQEASDGLVASELLGKMPRLPDLLICDVMMPRVDGFSLARLVKGRTELKGIPIIFLTARSEADAMMRGIAVGARHYLQKPFNVKDLLAKVEKSFK